MSTARRRTAAEALELLDQFRQDHGRLPKSTATDPDEKYLANFLFSTLRKQERRGTLKPAIRERAALIPGALAPDSHPDQDEVLAELRAFVQEHGHAPRHPPAKGVPAEEARLRSWIANNVSLDPALKSPRRRVRHEAILALLAGVPSYAEKDLDDRITVAEKFVRDHGHRPSAYVMPWLQDYVHGIYPIDGPYGRRSRMNESRAARLKAVIASPSPIDFRWRRNFDELDAYATANAGSLPHHTFTRLYKWLADQRREYRNDKLSPEREAILRALPGILPEVQELAKVA